MSRAFVTDGDEPSWLDEIPPTLSALLKFLTRENNGIPVVERKSHRDKNGHTIVDMSNGLSYTKDPDGKWKVIN